MSQPSAQRPPSAPRPRTLFEKIWDAHTVRTTGEGGPGILYIDLHLLHELTSRKAFDELRQRQLPVRRPGRTLATIDHIVPTRRSGDGGPLLITDPVAETAITNMVRNCRDFAVPLCELDDPRRGIVHIIGPELGLTQPGMTVVCGDSHTSTHGAFGVLAFGIGSSEVAEVLATQCLVQRKPKTFEVRMDGALPPGVVAKDVILALLAEIGIHGATGHVFEYRGEALRSLSMEGRMTVCNMSIEGGARAGMVAPDETTFEYLANRPYAPRGEEWERALEAWRRLPSDEGATYDRSITLDASRLEPMITYGTNPGMGMPITSPVPDPGGEGDAERRRELERALAYMRVEPGKPLLGQPIDVVFIGSCTNSRLSDLRLAAQVMDGRKVARDVRMLVVPGSQQVKAQAEAEGLDRIFTAAGAEWRDAGCSMCIAMNGDNLEAGQLAVSTTNRNFEGRQGQGGRTLLASPLTAAASAVAGHVADARRL